MGGLVGGIVGSVGGLMSGGSAQTANQNSATAITNATQQAYGGAKFNPIGITNNFGSSNFTQGPNGTVTSAGYTLNPTLQGIQNKVLGNASSYDPSQIGNAASNLYGGATGLFNTGINYISQNPQAAAQDWMNKQTNLLAPSREQTLANINNSNFQSGTTGLAVGGTSQGYGGTNSQGLAQTNPALQAYYNSLGLQDATLASQAQQQGNAQTQFGANMLANSGSLLGMIPSLTAAGYAPLNSMLGTAGTLESMGQTPYNMSTALASQQSGINSNAGSMLMSGTQAAQPYSNAAQSYNPMGSFLGGIGNSIANWQGGGTTNPYAGMGVQGNNSTGYTYANQAGPTQDGGNLSGGGLFSGASSWFK